MSKIKIDPKDNSSDILNGNGNSANKNVRYLADQKNRLKQLTEAKKKK